MKKYKLKTNLYFDETSDEIYDYCDKTNGKNDYHLWARTGSVFYKIDERDKRAEQCGEEFKEALDAENFLISRSGRFLYGGSETMDYFEEVSK